jgi:acetyltransferase-like isoleucine patch superfamily enzyme
MAKLVLDELDLASYGRDVTVYDRARLLDTQRISFGDHIIIDDFVLLQGGAGLTIGNYVHIASFVSLTGGGPCRIGHFAAIATGSRLLTGTDLADGSGLVGPQIPAEFRSVRRPGLEVGDLSFLGANCVVLPGITIGEGAVAGSGSLVLEDLEPWTINVGAPTRVLRSRPRELLLEHARALGYAPDAG